MCDSENDELAALNSFTDKVLVFWFVDLCRCRTKGTLSLIDSLDLLRTTPFLGRLRLSG